jgi:hypothetical protein
MKKYLSFLVFLIFHFNCFAQVKDLKLIKTTEFFEKLKRRDLFYDSNMNLIKEVYYSQNSQKIVNTIYYDNNQIERIIGYKEYPIIYFNIDFKKGEYSYPEENLELRFKGWFNFDGIQKSKGIIVNYTNGIKSGRLIQTDSGVIGKQSVLYQKVDPRYLKFNIVKFYNEYGTEDTYKLFKGLTLNFSNYELNGFQIGYYVNGGIKFSSKFVNNFIQVYNSYDQSGNFISRINTDSTSRLSKPFIYNGVLENKLGFRIKNDELSKTGNIEKENDFHYAYGGWNDYDKFDFNREGHGKFLNYIRNEYGIDNINYGGDFPDFHEKYFTDKKNLKEVFDKNKLMIIENNPEVLRVLFYIPKFYIKRYDFDRNDQSDLIFIE